MFGRQRRVFLLSAALTVAASLILVLPLGAPAHETPADVTVLMFVKPEGRTLRLLLRVPLTAMQDIIFPTRGPGYLEIDEADPELEEGAVVWLAEPLQLFENGTQLPFPEIAAIKVSIPSDQSFREYDTALEHVFGPKLSNDIDLIWQQAMLDVLFEYPIQSETSEFSIRPGLERLASRVQTVLRFMPPGGVERAFQLVGDPGLVPLDPRWHQAAFRFVKSGFLHILDGIDHLLFLLCLVIPFRRVRALVPIVTAFTVEDRIPVRDSKEVIYWLCCHVGDRRAFRVRPSIIDAFCSEQGTGGDQAHQEVLIKGEFRFPTHPGFELRVCPGPPSLTAGQSCEVLAPVSQRQV